MKKSRQKYADPFLFIIFFVVFVATPSEPRVSQASSLPIAHITSTNYPNLISTYSACVEISQWTPQTWQKYFRNFCDVNFKNNLCNKIINLMMRFDSFWKRLEQIYSMNKYENTVQIDTDFPTWINMRTWERTCFYHLDIMILGHFVSRIIYLKNSVDISNVKLTSYLSCKCYTESEIQFSAIQFNFHILNTKRITEI